MNKNPKTKPSEQPANTGTQIQSVIKGCMVTINFAPKAESVIPEVKRMMLSGIAKT